MAESSFEIETNGIVCLVCLKSKNCKFLNEWKEEVDSRTPTAFKMLLRYLKVDVGADPDALRLGGDGFKKDLNGVSLCEDCSQFTTDFLELYQDFESIRLQLDVCVGQLYEFMEAGGQDPGRVREFEKLASYGKREDENGVRIVKALRQDLIDKVCRKVRSSFPRISMGPKLKESDGKINITNPSLVQVRLQTDKEGRPLGEPEKLVSAVEAEEESLATTDPCCDFTADQADKAFETPEMDEGGGFGIGGAKSKGAGKPSGSSVFVLVEQDLSSGELRKHSSLASDAVNSELETSQRWKCIYCDKRCSRKDNLVAHQLQVHAKSFLSDKGRLPPHISEEELNASVAAVFEKLDPRQLQCPFCETKAVFTSKASLRAHLLRRHLEMVLENRDVRSFSNVGQGSGNGKSASPPSAPGLISGKQLLSTCRKRKIQVQLPSTHRVPVKSRCGPHLQKDTDIWKCAQCGKLFSLKGNYQTHQMKMHPKTVLKNKLPPSISEEALITAADTIAKRVFKEMGDGQSQRKYKCVLCNNEKNRVNHYYLRVHVLRRHLVKVIQEMEVGESVVEQS